MDIDRFPQARSYFEAIASWRVAYRSARLHFVARRHGERLLILSAKLHLDVLRGEAPRPDFRCGAIVAGQIDLSPELPHIEQVVAALLSPEGYTDARCDGRLTLVAEESALQISPPAMLHARGVANGNRIAVLAARGELRLTVAPQPESDWIVKAGECPFDSLDELMQEYGLDASEDDCCNLEVIAQTAVQVFAGSGIAGRSALLGLWTSSTMDKTLLRLGYRILAGGKTIDRGTVDGNSLDWTEAPLTMIGKVAIDVPAGAQVHCIVSYEGHAHHEQWIAGMEGTGARTDGGDRRRFAR